MATSATKFSKGYKGKKPPPKAPPKEEVAGPYRSQSSVPSVRKKATKREHRKVRRQPPPNPLKVESLSAPEPSHTSTAAKVVAKARSKPKGLGISVNPSDILKTFEQISGMSTPDALQPGSEVSRAARKVLAEEAENLAKQAKKNLSPEGKGGIKSNEPPTWDEARGVGAITSVVPASKAGELATTAGIDLAPKISTKLSKTASDLLEAAKATPAKTVEKAAQKAERVRTAPARAASKAKALPKEAREAVSSPAGRKAAAKGAGRTAVRHPIRSSGLGALAVPSGTVPGDVGKRARAFAEGTAKAVVENPLPTLGATGRGALGAFAAPLALGGAAVESVKRGDTEPLEQTGSHLLEGTVDMAKKLGSGNPKLVQRTTEKETGLTPFIPVPALLRRAKETDIYKGIRSDIRSAVEGKRAKTRNARVEARKGAYETGAPRHKLKEPKPKIEDSSRPGEAYVVRSAGKLRERARGRHYASRSAARTNTKSHAWSSQEAKPIVKELRQSKLTPREQIHFGDRPPRSADALAFVAKNSIPHDKEAGIAATKEALASYGKPEYGATPDNTFLDRDAARWILDHPKIWEDKHFWNAVSIFKRSSDKLQTSERHPWLASNDNIVNPRRAKEGLAPVLKPEERNRPETNALLAALFPEHPAQWTRKDSYDVVEGLRRDINEMTPDNPQRAVLKAKARRLEKTMNGLMKPPEHGGPAHGVSTTQTMPYTRKMVSDFVNEMKGEHKRLGLAEPAGYVANKLPKAVAEAGRARTYVQTGKTPWPSQGKAASSGNALSDFGSTFLYSMHSPRALRAMNKEIADGLARHSRKVGGKGYFTERQLEQLYNTHQVPDGVVPVDTQMLKQPLVGEHMGDPEGVTPEDFAAMLHQEYDHGSRFNNTSGAELRKEMMDMAASGAKGKKYALVNEGYMKEIVGQLDKVNGISTGLAKASNLSTGVILNSPGFAAIQFAQEGVPMLAAAGKNARYLGSAVRAVRESRRFDPELQAQIKAVAGSSAGLRGSPWVADPIAATAPKALWRHAWEVVNGTKTSNFDRSRSGLMREVAAAAKVEGDFHAWRKGAQNLFKDIDEATKAMKGMTPGERLAYAASNPKLADRLQVHTNEWLGNWNSFTRLEKQIAPVTIFYSFQRYAAMWMLWHFPLNHPLAATALSMLGEQNANELEELAASEGGKVSNPLHFTEPVVVTGKGPVSSKNAFVLPAGKRAFPGLNAAGEALATGNPAQLTGVLQPSIQIIDSAVRGVDPFTGQPIKGNPFSYIAKQLVSQSPAARFFKLPSRVPGQPEQSSLSKAFERLGQGTTARSAYAVTSGQSGRNFGLESKLETALKVAAENSTEKREELAHEGKLNLRLKEQMEARSSKAANEIGQVMKVLGLKAEDDREYERFKEQFYGTRKKGGLPKLSELDSGKGGLPKLSELGKKKGGLPSLDELR